METHQASLKHVNFTLSYHSYTTILPQIILQLQLHFSCTLGSITNLRFTKNRVSWNGELPQHQGCTTFCYCRPHYFYLYDVRPPVSSSYIYEILPSANQHRTHSNIICVFILYVASPFRLLRVLSIDFLALRLFCFNIRQRGRRILHFKLHMDGRKLHYRRPHTAVSCAPLHTYVPKFKKLLTLPKFEWSCFS